MFGKKELIGLLSIFIVLVIWQFASHYIFNPYLVPPPSVVIASLWEMVQTGEIWEHIWASVRRIMIGYFWGNLIGICLGLLMGRIFAVRCLLDPAISFLRSLSPVAIIPLAIVWFGVGEASKHFVILYGSVIVVLLNTMAGVMATPPIRIRAAQCLGASNFKIFTTVIIPSTWPYILTGMRVTLGICFASVVAAEMIAAEAGIGYMIMQARLMILINRMFVGLICLGILGAITDQIYQYIISKTMRRYMLEGNS